MAGTLSFTPKQYTGALESWLWLDLAGKEPLCTSPFGDIFLKGADGIWWLDTLGGRLSRPWQSVEELRTALRTPEGQDEFLLGGLADAAATAGLRPLDSQVLSFSLPPVLGGALVLDNVELCDFVVSVNITGQIHDQIRNLPPGTTIKGFTMDGGQRRGGLFSRLRRR